MNQRIVDRFLSYIAIDSETRNEKEFALFLEKELQAMGFETMIDDAGQAIGGNSGNLIAKLKGTLEVTPLLFSAHMDTVTPGNGIKAVIEDGIIRSDGTTILGGDDKAGIAAIVEGIQFIQEEKIPHGDIELLFTIAEEGGLLGSANLNMDHIESTEGFILDSSKLPGELITNGPAQAKLDIVVHGKAAHAGVCPENGISAIQVLARAIDRMELLRIDEETTANIGIVNGGEATNIVMPEIVVKAEVRSLNNDKLKKQMDHMVACLEEAAEFYKTRVDIDQLIQSNSFNIAEDANVVKKAKNAFKALGIDATTTFTGGGSDANVLNGRGIEIINLGIGEKQAHTLNEHYYIKDLETMSNFVKILIQQHQ